MAGPEPLADDFDLAVRLGIYRHFAGTGSRPTVEEIAARAGPKPAAVREAWRRLERKRVLVLEADGASIRMAPPFSGVPTQHVVESTGVSYYANCCLGRARDPCSAAPAGDGALELRSILAAPGARGGPVRPPASEWLFHCLVPAAHWWDDIVFT